MALSLEIKRTFVPTLTVCDYVMVKPIRIRARTAITLRTLIKYGAKHKLRSLNEIFSNRPEMLSFELVCEYIMK